MSLLPLAAALAGIALWFLLLACLDQQSRSRFPLVVEAVAVYAVTATLSAVALVSFGVFRPLPALALATVPPVVALPRLGGRRLRMALRGPLASRSELPIVVVLALVAPIALPRLEPLHMDSDAGVYANRAIHHLETGGLRGRIPLRDRLHGDLLASFDRDNMLRLSPSDPAGDLAGLYLPGTYVPASDHDHFVFQFLPGWPMVMALWAGVFGVSHMLYALAFVYALGVLLFGLLLERLTQGGFARLTTLLIFASSPLLLFLAKYTTSEIFLLFLVLFVAYLLDAESSLHAVLAAAGVLLFALSHSSTFLYAPLLLLATLVACRSTSRRLALFSALAFGVLLVSLPLGRFFSPFYMRDVFARSFSFLPLSDPATAGFTAVAAFYAAGLALSLVLLRRVSDPPSWLAVRAAAAERLLGRALLPTLAVLAAWTAWRGYQLGWTDRFARDLSSGAWGLRAEYADRGWTSLVHLNVVSMVMATSLVGLPAVLVLALTRGRHLCARQPHLFLLIAVVWTLGLYTVFRVDTPFNYYGSRYFLPVLVPASLLLLASLLGNVGLGRGTLALVALVGIGFNLYFDRALYRYPSSSEKLRFVQAVAEKVGRDRVLFVREDERACQLLVILEQSLHGIAVVRVTRSPGVPPMRLVERYAAQLGLHDAAILASVPPADRRPFAMLELKERGFPQRGIAYPTQHAEWSTQYYVYHLVSPGDR
jgi:hypothetical protein